VRGDCQLESVDESYVFGKVAGTKVKIVERLTKPGVEHVFVFDRRPGRNEKLFSLGVPKAPPV
jgi:hypothetical protein